MKEGQEMSSIDKVLDYIEQDIEKSDDEIVVHLTDVHSILTKIKVCQIRKNPITDDNDDDLYIYSYMTSSSLNATFGNWESNTEIADDKVIQYNDLVYMEISYSDGIMECIVSLHYNIGPVLVAELINTLKDIYGAGLKVNGDTFTVDEVNGEYIWGSENINNHLVSINGKRIKPIIVYNDDTAGNC